VSFEVGHAQALSFADAEFDASLSLLVFNFISDPRNALDQLQRVTRPGGQICAATWDYGDGMEMLRIFWDAAVELDSSAVQVDERHTLLCGRNELSTLWREGGLVGIEERSLEIAMQFRSFDDFWEPFLLGQRPAGAYINRTSRELRIALRDRVARRLPGTIHRAAFELRARAWAVRGTAPQA
jgi:SAM-dependent methyltransferase